MPHEWEEVQVFNGVHELTFEWECRNCHTVLASMDHDEGPPSPDTYIVVRRHTDSMTCEEIIALEIQES